MLCLIVGIFCAFLHHVSICSGKLTKYLTLVMTVEVMSFFYPCQNCLISSFSSFGVEMNFTPSQSLGRLFL